MYSIEGRMGVDHDWNLVTTGIELENLDQQVTYLKKFWRELRTYEVKPPKLTSSQIYTLRRMKSGTKYRLRGDGKKADEIVPTGRYSTEPKNAPSIPVLYRAGMVRFSNNGLCRDATLWYSVEITDLGRAVAKTKTREELLSWLNK
jgi:hypothetical protein